MASFNPETNPQFKKAFELVSNTSKNVLITGRAGTGKSTFLRHLKENLEKNFAILAPTGISAVNVGGQTIHSFFGFRPDITLERVSRLDPTPSKRKLYESLETLIIDEVSMVRADLFDCVERFLKIWGPWPGKPFGGIQILLIGDLYQLPPVVKYKEKDIFFAIYETPYFFSSKAFKENSFEHIEFEKVYRQKDQKFLEILNKIRTGTIDDETLKVLNGRVIPDFKPSEENIYVYLTTTNAKADSLNEGELQKLKGQIYEFQATMLGKIEGDELPAPPLLKIKEGAQIMLVSNDPNGRWVNGDVGRVLSIYPERATVVVKLNRGDVVEVTPNTWEIYEYYYNEQKKEIDVRVIGTYVQIPMKLAWAITIHKSQGLTFERIIVDLEKGTFAHGQLYVALSRCTSLEGIVLTRPVKKDDIKLDRVVVKFLTELQCRKAE